ncbi:MAG: GIY-YIG nuclease family protein [Candidatus Caldatribacteriaceae bacterium]
MACYFLYIFLEEMVSLPIGKKGVLPFSRGFYLYVGRSKRRVFSRLLRHLQKEKRCHWHIDFLLQKAKVLGVILWEGDEECYLASFLRHHPLIMSSVFGFGSSDCRCPSHLFFGGEKFAFWSFLLTLQELPYSFQVFLCKEFLHHLGITNGVVPEAVVEE